MKKIIFILAVLTTVQPFVFAQNAGDVINENATRRIMQFLAGDSMKGRGNGSPELLKAGIFIGNEFRKSGLHTWPGYFSYYMPFRPFGGQKNVVTDELVWNGKKCCPRRFYTCIQFRATILQEVLTGLRLLKPTLFLQKIF